MVELLLAIFIFAVIVASVYGTYKATFAIIHDSEYQATIVDRSGFVLSRIGEDLESLILGKSGFLLGEEQTFGDARNDSLSFLSSAHIVLGKTDVPRGRILLSYLAEVDERSGLFSLYRAEMVVLPGVTWHEGVTRKYLLCSGLKEIRFTYYDAVGNALTIWKSEEIGMNQDQKTPVIPAAVGVELVFPEKVAGKKMQVFKTTVALPQQGDR